MSKVFKKSKNEYLTNDYDKGGNLSSLIKNQSTHSIYKLNENTENKIKDCSFINGEISTYSNIFSDKLQSNKQQQSSNIVPILSNVDEIFQFLSQNIAKYCQVLSDLTNSEVFFKAQLPSSFDFMPNENGLANNLKCNESSEKSSSLYWGTDNMLFQYSHGKGLAFNNGDCLIRVNQKSFTKDINLLIEEIFNEPNLKFKYTLNDKITNLEKLQHNYCDLNKLNHHNKNLLAKKKDEMKIRECFITLNQMDKNNLEKKLNYFEKSNNKINQETNMHEYFYELDLVEESELYTDKCKIKIEESLENFEKDLFKDDKNCSLNENDIGNLCEKEVKIVFINNILDHLKYEEFFRCNICEKSYFKHLTQLKVTF